MPNNTKIGNLEGKNAKSFKDFRKDYYTGLKGIYFYNILKTIIKIGNLNNRDVKILDFGCGTGKLKKMLHNKVVGYDLLPDLSDVRDWRKVKFDVIVANAVFYLFTAKELRKFLKEVHTINPKVEMIFGTKKKYPILNCILKYLSGEFDAHAGTKLTPKKELAILQEKMDIIKKESVFLMSDVYLMVFKDNKNNYKGNAKKINI